MRNKSDFLRTEIILLILGIIPSIISFLIIISGTPLANEFIKVQLLGLSAFNVLSFGIPVILSSKSLKKNIYPSKKLIISNSLLFIISCIVLTFFDSILYFNALIIAHTFFVSVLYRIKSSLIFSRLILISQFLIFFDLSYELFLSNIIFNSYIIYYIFNLTNYNNIKTVKLFDAWVSSFIKDFFLRGHIWVLNIFGFNIELYSKILRLLEIFSRPFDYIFQRLVDESNLKLFRNFILVVFMAPFIFFIIHFIKPFTNFNYFSYFSLIFPVLIVVYIFNKYFSFSSFSKFNHRKVYINYSISLIFYIISIYILKSSSTLIISLVILHTVCLILFLYAKNFKKK